MRFAALFSKSAFKPSFSISPVDFSSGHERSDNSARQLPTGERRVAAFRFEISRVNRPFTIRVKNSQVGPLAFGKCAAL